MKKVGDISAIMQKLPDMEVGHRFVCFFFDMMDFPGVRDASMNSQTPVNCAS